jgi:hypothetical protein
MNDPIVLSGVLSQVSSSKEVGNTWKYDHIKIGGRRIDNINVHKYINDDFYSAYESEVSISIFPGINKHVGGTVLAIKKGESVDKVPYVSSSEIWGETFKMMIATSFIMMIVGGIAGTVILLSVYFVLRGLFNFNDSNANAVGFSVAALVVGGLYFHSFFTHKMSPINRREFYNKAAQVFD